MDVESFSILGYLTCQSAIICSGSAHARRLPELWFGGFAHVSSSQWIEGWWCKRLALFALQTPSQTFAECRIWHDGLIVRRHVGLTVTYYFL